MTGRRITAQFSSRQRFSHALADRASTALRRSLHRRGIDVIRYPSGTSLGYHLKQLLDVLQINCVLDVGANVGDYGATLRRLGYLGRIVSFEPVLENTKHIRRRSDEKWDVVSVALGSEEGTRTIILSENPMLHSFLALSDYGRRATGIASATGRGEDVAVVTLDAVWNDYVRPDSRVFLKVDTQGWELEVLRGARRSLPNVAGLQIEIAHQASYEGQPSYLTTLALVEEAGFKATGIFPFFTDRDDFRLIEADWIFRRTD